MQQQAPPPPIEYYDGDIHWGSDQDTAYWTNRGPAQREPFIYGGLQSLQDDYGWKKFDPAAFQAHMKQGLRRDPYTGGVKMVWKDPNDHDAGKRPAYFKRGLRISKKKRPLAEIAGENMELGFNKKWSTFEGAKRAFRNSPNTEVIYADLFGPGGRPDGIKDVSIWDPSGDLKAVNGYYMRKARAPKYQYYMNNFWNWAQNKPTAKYGDVFKNLYALDINRLDQNGMPMYANPAQDLWGQRLQASRKVSGRKVLTDFVFKPIFADRRDQLKAMGFQGMQLARIYQMGFNKFVDLCIGQFMTQNNIGGRYRNFREDKKIRQEFNKDYRSPFYRWCVRQIQQHAPVMAQAANNAIATAIAEYNYQVRFPTIEGGAAAGNVTEEWNAQEDTPVPQEARQSRAVVPIPNSNYLDNVKHYDIFQSRFPVLSAQLEASQPSSPEAAALPPPQQEPRASPISISISSPQVEVHRSPIPSQHVSQQESETDDYSSSDVVFIPPPDDISDGDARKKSTEEEEQDLSVQVSDTHDNADASIPPPLSSDDEEVPTTPPEKPFWGPEEEQSPKPRRLSTSENPPIIGADNPLLDSDDSFGDFGGYSDGYLPKPQVKAPKGHLMYETTDDDSGAEVLKETDELLNLGKPTYRNPPLEPLNLPQPNPNPPESPLIHLNKEPDETDRYLERLNTMMNDRSDYEEALKLNEEIEGWSKKARRGGV